MAKIIHSNRSFKVEEIPITVRGKKLKYYGIVCADTVGILPITRKGYILLERQYRPPTRTTLYEIPAGHIENGEKPINTAMRELEEETGYKASKIKQINFFYPSPGILCRKEYLCMAWDLKKSKLHLDKDEIIKTEEVSISKAIKMIKSNRISDGKTIIAILYYKFFIEKK
ncbi:MAG: NUDIX hydrolase [Candidatus Micrarchaeales archaeon]